MQVRACRCKLTVDWAFSFGRLLLVHSAGPATNLVHEIESSSPEEVHGLDGWPCKAFTGTTGIDADHQSFRIRGSLSLACVISRVELMSGLRHIRRKEMTGIRKILIIRAANQAMAFSVPVGSSLDKLTIGARFGPGFCNLRLVPQKSRSCTSRTWSG